jgi:uncharacterized RDD family membrane protein YckC
METKETKPTKEVKAETVSTHDHYAGFWRRLCALLVDGFIVGTISNIINFSTQNKFAWLSLLLSAGYFVFFWVKEDGETLGNKLLNIKVKRINNQPMEWSTGVIRYIGYIVSYIVFGLGFLWVAWDAKKQGWHDKIANTVVVQKSEESRALVMGIILGLYALIIVGAMIVGIIAAVMIGSMSKDPQARNEFTNAFQKYAPTLSQSKADMIAQNLFDEINRERTRSGLAALKMDNNLCEYAQRRLHDYETQGGYDRGKGFYEDMGNTQVADQYFTDYPTANEYYYPINSLTLTSEIVADMAKGRTAQEALNSDKMVAACVQASNHYLEFVGASQK